MSKFEVLKTFFLQKSTVIGSKHYLLHISSPLPLHQFWEQETLQFPVKYKKRDERHQRGSEDASPAESLRSMYFLNLWSWVKLFSSLYILPFLRLISFSLFSNLAMLKKTHCLNLTCIFHTVYICLHGASG